MNRQIQFKAITSGGKEWAEGYYSKHHTDSKRTKEKTFITKLEGKNMVEVIPETVCMISEFKYDQHFISVGDMFKLGELEYVVVFEKGSFQLRHTKQGYSFNGMWGLLSRLFDADMESILDEIEPIGNIHDKHLKK